MELVRSRGLSLVGGSWTIRASVANVLPNHNAFGILPDAGEPASRWYGRHGLGLLPFLKAELRW